MYRRCPCNTVSGVDTGEKVSVLFVHCIVYIAFCTPPSLSLTSRLCLLPPFANAAGDTPRCALDLEGMPAAITNHPK